MAETTTIKRPVPSTERGIGARLRSRRARTVLFEAIMHIVLLAGGATFLIPFFWLVSTSLKAPGKEFAFPPEWIPDPVVWQNYPDTLFGVLPFDRFFVNTFIISLLSLIGTVLSASLVAFGFARIRFDGRDTLFIVLISTLMLPAAVTMIPTFILFRMLGWIDTWLPLIVPSFFGGGAFAIFLMRQFFMTIPYDLDEAAKIDGASNFRVWWQILMPLSKPVLATIAVLNFMDDWNSFLRPLIYISTLDKQMLGVGLAFFRGLSSGYSKWNLMMAAATMMTIPIIVLFFFAQQYFVKGIVMSGMGGR
jgi:ABC-type glycerol-3-phosphate transport system permease component